MALAIKKDGTWPSKQKTIRTSKVPFSDKGGKAEIKPTGGIPHLGNSAES
jgi:hypothetical protein